MVRPPRFPLATLPTPLTRAEHLADAVGSPVELLVKRDDLIGFGVAAGKTRALEFLLGEALAHRCDVLVTGGSASSNFCPAAALAARRAGLDCELLMSGDLAGSANVELSRRARAHLNELGEGDRSRIDAAISDRAAELVAAGRKPYAMPRGGSTPVGAVGFARAAEELAYQLDASPALVVIPIGSGGSCAGLLAGSKGWPLLGVSVSRPAPEITEIVHRLAGECAALLGRSAPDRSRLEIVDGRGPGFGVASPADRDAAALALETEGLLLDHTYTAKSLAALLPRLRDVRSGPVVYWHTGGLATTISEYQRPKGGHDELA